MTLTGKYICNAWIRSNSVLNSNASIASIVASNSCRINPVNYAALRVTRGGQCDIITPELKPSNTSGGGFACQNDVLAIKRVIIVSSQRRCGWLIWRFQVISLINMYIQYKGILFNKAIWKYTRSYQLHCDIETICCRVTSMDDSFVCYIHG